MKKNIALFIIFIVAVCLLPFFISGYWLRVLTQTFMFAAIATGSNIIIGYTGYPAFGNIAFFGIGAYVTGVLMTKYEISFIATLPFCALGGFIVAILLGIPLLRLKGHYFAIATVGVMEAMKEIVDNMTEITGGGLGLTLPIMEGDPAYIYKFFYYTILLIMLLSIAIAFIVWKSKFGYALRAIRIDEDAASVMGINTALYKTFAWGISGALVSIAGGAYAYWLTYIDPSTVFVTSYSVKMFAMILLGGATTIFGPMLGAFILELISEIVWSKFIEIHGMILGLLIILVVLFIPKGLFETFKGGFSFRKLIMNLRENRL
ncbi:MULTISPECIES: branched-chain amino acid ABC transporter permease [Thermodesulfovibrio]|uniref:branched-chain amino acid ABC transporter permease n=1 Tax=Thermodesulfovibrio yellowstonii TaxID=28262 RepID=UPI0003F4ACE6|nr:branched-chain amino acid ABC transporter permease [Thermodesulfovibrio islandicus]